MSPTSTRTFDSPEPPGTDLPRRLRARFRQDLSYSSPVSGQAKVIRVFDELDRAYALKILRVRRPENANLLRQEAQALAILSAKRPHPHIVQVHGVETDDDGMPALLLEWVEGRSLSARLRDDGALPLGEALDLATEIASAMHAAHDNPTGQGIVHRDLKPSNVLLRRDERGREHAVVIDFGIALMESVRSPVVGGAAPEPPTVSRFDVTTQAQSPRGGLTPTGSGDGFGTPGYMSPEQAIGRSSSRRSDLFAFGCLLYECLVGARPFSDAFARGGRDAYIEALATLDADLDRLPPESPVGLRALIAQCLRRRDTERPSGFDAVLASLEAIRGEAEPRHNIDPEPSGWVERVDLSDRVRAAFAAPDVRIVSLHGPGGSGKSRLARRVARSLASDYDDGCWYVSLVGIVDLDEVVGRIAAELGVDLSVDRDSEGRRTALDTMLDRLGKASRLLVLDDCDACIGALRAFWRRARVDCPALRVIATARLTPIVPDARPVEIGPMSLPPANARTRAEILDSEAGSLLVRTLIDRIAEVEGDGWEPSDRDAPALARLCHQVAGLPLVIELAASAAQGIPLGRLADRVNRLLFDLSGERESDAKQSSLGALLEYGWQQLDDDERWLLPRLSLFVEGFSAPMAEALLESDDVFIDVVLAGLVRKSLLTLDRSRVPARYRMLAPIREWCARRFAALDDEERRRSGERVANAVLAVAIDPLDDAADVAPDERDSAARARRRTESANIRSALDWLLAHDVPGAAKLVTEMRYHWLNEGAIVDADRATADVLHAADALDPATRAFVQCFGGAFAWMRGDFGRAETLLRASVEGARAIGDSVTLVRSLTNLGGQLEEQARDDEHERLRDSEALQREAVEICSTPDLIGLRPSIEMNHGVVLTRLGRLDEARAVFERTLAAFESNARHIESSYASFNLGTIALVQDDLEAARTAAATSAAHAVVIENDERTVQAGWLMACALARAGDRDAALRLVALVERLEGLGDVRARRSIIDAELATLRAAQRPTGAIELPGLGGTTDENRRRLREAIAAACGARRGDAGSATTG